jgi:hypothetical protein
MRKLFAWVFLASAAPALAQGSWVAIDDPNGPQGLTLSAIADPPGRRGTVYLHVFDLIARDGRLGQTRSDCLRPVDGGQPRWA